MIEHILSKAQDGTEYQDILHQLKSKFLINSHNQEEKDFQSFNPAKTSSSRENNRSSEYNSLRTPHEQPLGVDKYHSYSS
jgi:hypothetical protein